MMNREEKIEYDYNAYSHRCKLVNVKPFGINVFYSHWGEVFSRHIDLCYVQRTTLRNGSTKTMFKGDIFECEDVIKRLNELDNSIYFSYMIIKEIINEI